jgi:polysaccharide pyruvyl transferase WcaK-like protein
MRFLLISHNGAFISKITARWAGQALSRATVILARDAKTVQLLEQYGVKASIIHSADAAISLLPEDSQRAQSAILAHSIDHQTVALVIRTHLYSQLMSSVYQRYLAHMQTLIQGLQTAGFKVVLTGTINKDLVAAKTQQPIDRIDAAQLKDTILHMLTNRQKYVNIMQPALNHLHHLSLSNAEYLI